MSLHGYGPHLLSGAWLTVELGLLSLLVAALIGMFSALAKLSSITLLRFAAQFYTTLIRGIPDLVLMLIIFYGGQIALNQASEALGWGYININPFIAGVLTLGFIYGAYMTETFRGAIMAVPRGQMEAAFSIGMSQKLAFRRILFPQMMRHALPGFGNNWLVMIKATSLVSIIGLEDVVRIGDMAGKSLHQPFDFFLAVALVFLALTTVSVILLRWAEAHYGLEA
ncbi:MAG: ABC transporter permease [Alphaproteobacteria bacterium]